MFDTINKKQLAVSVGLPAAVGLLASTFSGAGHAMAFFHRPALTPSFAVFAAFWLVMYVLLGAAAYLAVNNEIVRIFYKPHTKFSARVRTRKQMVLTLYLAHLALHFLWGVSLFGFYWYFFALLLLVLQIVLVLHTARFFFNINPTAGLLMTPYALWLLYVLYLNAGLWRLNG